MKRIILMMLIGMFSISHAFTQTDDGPPVEKIKQIQKEFEELERPLSFECNKRPGEGHLDAPRYYRWLTLAGETKDFADKHTTNELAYSLWKYLDKPDNYYDADAFVILAGKIKSLYTEPDLTYKSKHDTGNWDKVRKTWITHVKGDVGRALGHNRGDSGGWFPVKLRFNLQSIVKDKENREKNIQALCAALKDENLKRENPYEIIQIISILEVLHDKNTIPDIGNYIFYTWKKGKNYINDSNKSEEGVLRDMQGGECTAPYTLSTFGIDALTTVFNQFSKTTPQERSINGGCALFITLKILDWAKIDNTTALKSLQNYRQSKSLSDEEGKALDELAEAIKTRDNSKIRSGK